MVDSASRRVVRTVLCAILALGPGAAAALLADSGGLADLGGQSGPVDPLGGGAACSEDFDGVTAPALPAGWTTSSVNGAGCTQASDWTTSTTSPDSAPNVAFHNDPNCITDNYLVSPAFAPQAGAQLTFRNSTNMEGTIGGTAFDGGVLEISINGGAFADIIAAGGSWVNGGYNGTVSVNFQSPIAGRMAWTGNSNGYFTTTVNLPAAAIGQSVNFRFRMASDISVASQFWRVDSVALTPCGSGCSEDFDGVTAPAIPAGWATSFVNGGGCTQASPWTTNTTTPDTAPNVAFHNDPNCITDNYLDSPPYGPQAGAQLTFRNSTNMEGTIGGTAFDGGVLEISINGGAFADIIAAGGSWVNGGYNGTVSVNFGNPLAGRMAWTGNSNGYFTTTVNLPAAAIGQSVNFRFRMASDSSVSGQFWRVDSIDLTPCGGPAPCSITPPADIVVNNDAGQCGAVVNYPAPQTSGSCGPIVCTPASGSFFAVGTTPIGCSEGGGASAGFNITVNDVEAPVISCPADIEFDLLPDSDGDVVNYDPPTVGDNCPGVIYDCQPASGSFFPAGQTPVNCGAQDAAGNQAACGFNVILNAVSVLEVPTVSSLGLAALALLLAAAALVWLRRNG